MVGQTVRTRIPHCFCFVLYIWIPCIRSVWMFSICKIYGSGLNLEVLPTLKRMTFEVALLFLISTMKMACAVKSSKITFVAAIYPLNVYLIVTSMRFFLCHTKM